MAPYAKQFMKPGSEADCATLHSASQSASMHMNDSATTFIAEPQDANLDYEIADEALEVVAQFGGGRPTLIYNSYCFTCDGEARSITLTNHDPLPMSGLSQ